MRVHHNCVAATFLGLAAVLALGCSDAIAPALPATGAIEITVLTAGAIVDLDADGYALIIDGGQPHAIAVNGALTIADVAPGNHLVGLSGLAATCTVTSPNPIEVNVTASKASTAAFSVSCAAPEECVGWYCDYSPIPG